MGRYFGTSRSSNDDHLRTARLLVVGPIAERTRSIQLEEELLGHHTKRSEPSLLLRMRIFSDKCEVEERIGEVLVGESGVGKHAGARMTLPDGPGSFLVVFEAQDIGIP